MNESDQLLLFVNEFCNQMASMEKNRRAMYSWYAWSDKREGSVEERFWADAKSWGEHEKLWRRR
jgi:hypothetical protein